MWFTRLAGNVGRKKIAKNSPSAHHRTTLSGHIFATKAHIHNQKKNLLNSNTPSICPPQYCERCTSGWDRFRSLGHPSKFQWVSRLGSITARHSGSGRQPDFAALPPIFGRVAITLGIGPHSNVICVGYLLNIELLPVGIVSLPWCESFVQLAAQNTWTACYFLNDFRWLGGDSIGLSSPFSWTFFFGFFCKCFVIAANFVILGLC